MTWRWWRCCFRVEQAPTSSRGRVGPLSSAQKKTRYGGALAPSLLVTEMVVHVISHVVSGPQAHEVVAMLREFVFCEPAQIVLPGDINSPWENTIWLGQHRAADVRWATDRGFGAVMSIYAPGGRDPKHLWLSEEDDEDDVRWHAVEVEADDKDTSRSSWERLLDHAPALLAFIGMAVREKRDLLVHCQSGVSTSAAVIVLYMMIKRRVRFKAAVEHLQSLRREVALSRSMANGLASLQEELDRRKLDRLDQRLRNSSVLSIGF